MADKGLPALSLSEWAVLGLLVESPSYGFAIARELAPEGDLGQIWSVRRPEVYRALDHLEELALAEPLGVEPGEHGPVRHRLKATRTGTVAIDRWLCTPSPHVRDLRTRLLLQLRLLDRRRLDLVPLATAQLDVLSPIVAALDQQVAEKTDFGLLLARWRFESAQAAVRFLERIIAERPVTAGRRRAT